MPFPITNPTTAEDFQQELTREIMDLSRIESSVSRSQSDNQALRRYIDGLRQIVSLQARLNAKLLQKIAALESKPDVNP